MTSVAKHAISCNFMSFCDDMGQRRPKMFSNGLDCIGCVLDFAPGFAAE